MVIGDPSNQMEHGMEWLENCRPKEQILVKKYFQINRTYRSFIFDTAVTDFTVTKERSEVMTFAQPILDIYHSMFIKNPEGSMNFNSYTAPLTDLAWMFVGIFVIVGSMFLFIISQWVKSIIIKDSLLMNLSLIIALESKSLITQSLLGASHWYWPLVVWL